MHKKEIPEKFLAGKEFRNFGIRMIIELHSRVKYNLDTLFVACAIFDRYLTMTGLWNQDYLGVCLVSHTSLIIAAKIEDPLGPCGKEIERLLNVLKYEE